MGCVGTKGGLHEGGWRGDFLCELCLTDRVRIFLTPPVGLFSFFAPEMERQEFLAQWFAGKAGRPLMIAGPCGAESRRQVLSTARSLSAFEAVTVFRCGIWKPRTNPGNFEGMGTRALGWLAEARAETGLLMAVEVANHRHVEASLRAGIDILWIGARTCSSPFAVQEISQALRGIDVPVLVKNPLVPDSRLWYGAIDRLQRMGVQRIAAVHRGFFPVEWSNLRNSPMWEVPIGLKRQYPDLRLINDPSHIAGKAALVPQIAQRALDMRFDGLMVEVHPQPESAKSDADQQLTPAAFGSMLGHFRYPGEWSPNEEFNRQLQNLRTAIDEVDGRLLHLLRDRNQLVEKIAALKVANQISALQMKRWDEIIQTRTQLAGRLGLNNEFVIKLLELLHDEALNIQESFPEQKSP